MLLLKGIVLFNVPCYVDHFNGHRHFAEGWRTVFRPNAKILNLNLSWSTSFCRQHYWSCCPFKKNLCIMKHTKVEWIQLRELSDLLQREYPVVFDSSLTIWCVKVFQLIVDILCPTPQISYFSQKFWFLLMENGISRSQSGC